MLSSFFFDGNPGMAHRCSGLACAWICEKSLSTVPVVAEIALLAATDGHSEASGRAKIFWGALGGAAALI